MEVVREILEEGFLGRTWVANNGGEPELAKQIEGDVFDITHDGLLIEDVEGLVDPGTE
jgi:hypothetical protein